MAAPFVTGMAALFLQNNPQATPADVHQAIVSFTTVGVLRNIGINSPNRLAYWNEHCTDQVYWHNGSFINAQFDNRNCYVNHFPAWARHIFVWNNGYYAQKQVNCPIGYPLNNHCFVGAPPFGTTAIIQNNQYLHTPIEGDICPNNMVNGYCFVANVPASNGFIYQNKFYAYANQSSCPTGFDNGVHCYFGAAPADADAFIDQRAMYYAE